MQSRFPVAAAPAGGLAAWRVISDNREASDRAIVADLRRAAARYPLDKRLAALIRRTLDGNARFAAFWREGAVGGHAEDRKTIQHPEIGDITMDCDVLSDSDTDLKIFTPPRRAARTRPSSISLRLRKVMERVSAEPDRHGGLQQRAGGGSPPALAVACRGEPVVAGRWPSTPGRLRTGFRRAA